MKLCQTCNTIAGDENKFCAHDGQRLVHDELSTKLQEALGAKYTLTKLIGTGAMGAVYRARHQDLDDVAIKVMLGPPDNQKLSQRFLREARALRKLHNQHAVLVYDLERSPNGLTYMVMEMVEGRSLRAVLKERHQLPLAEAMEVAEAVCDALQAAHERGIIHRDLKPDNILVAEETTGRGLERIIKIADFGIAKLRGTREGGEEASMQLTKYGAPIGTPFYMSPEQWFGDGAGFTALDGRTDIYSLGCTLYELLAGRPPFTSLTTEELRRMHLDAAPQALNLIAPQVPEAVSRVIIRTLEKDRDLRPASAREFAVELRRAYQESGPVAGERARSQTQSSPKAAEEASKTAKQVAKLQKTEEIVPGIRNWAAGERQLAIEQMRAHSVSNSEPQASESGPAKDETPASSTPELTATEPDAPADETDDFEETLVPGKFRIKAEPPPPSPDVAPADEAEFQETLLFTRNKKAAPAHATTEIVANRTTEIIAEGAKTQRGGIRLELMIARVGSKRIGLLANEVDTVADWRAPMPLPNAPVGILGVVNIRGRMLTLLDPRALLGEEKRRRPLAQPVSIIALRGDEQLALAVNSIEGSTETEVEELPTADEEGNVVSGFAQVKQGYVTVLNARELFAAATRNTERRRQRVS